ALASLALLLATEPVPAQQSSSRAVPLATRDDSIAAVLRAATADARLEELRWPRFPEHRDDLRGIYEPRAYAPLWFAAGRPGGQARAAVDVLLDAKSRGLDPADYDAARLDRELRTLQAGSAVSGATLAGLDAALTVNLLRLVSAVHSGRVNPRALGHHLQVAPERLDLATLVPGAVDADRIAELVTDAEPAVAQYDHLVRALATYRQLAAAPDGQPVPALASALRPGSSWHGVPWLRRRLARVRDLPSDARAPASDSLRYTDELAAGVRRFQSRHGLDVDGVVGPATMRALRVPLDARVRQLELALERVRWLPEPPEGPLIVVNIPAFQLHAFDSAGGEGTPSLVSRVIVGRASATPTPLLTAHVRYVEFRPYWNVPRSILRSEILPALRRDPDYLRTHDMELVRHFADDAPVLAPTPQALAALRAGTLQVRQRPGSRNPLGAVKLVFPNSANVYLHGTPDTTLFARTRRDFSHGCMRVEQAEALANWVLRGHSAWPPERVHATMREPGGPTRAELARPVPVLIVYATAIARADGTVMFFEDIYRHDRRLEAALARGAPYGT
ncbi:MAG TPA: L,D-transpeptidase family protein, partial [Gemmatimonadaceae bacterium]|nr:L,D-transpeptidase family protein [Gemmatimonadaceae bacterium]